jgi:hypothetical protein
MATVPRGGHVVDDGALFYAARRDPPGVVGYVVAFGSALLFFCFMRTLSHKKWLKTQSYA